MPRTGERGGPQTRARILDVAHLLFLDRGYDSVTVAEIAREAGVSSVTVFKHFPRKEDLFLDRSVEAIDLVRSTVRDRGAKVDVLAALQAMTIRLFDERHPLSGVDDRSIQFFRTVAASPALVARAREIAAELQRTLADELADDPTAVTEVGGDGRLLAAFFIAGYSTVLVETAGRLIAGAERSVVVNDHRTRLETMFAALRGGFGTRS